MGQMRRNISTRIMEHVGHIKNQQWEKLAVIEQGVETGQTITFEETKILVREQLGLYGGSRNPEGSGQLQPKP